MSFNTKQKLQTDRKRDNVCTQNIEFSQDFSLSIRAIIFSQLVVLLTPHNTQSAPYNLVMHLIIIIIIIFVVVSGGIWRAK
jgi:lipopolysaccharide export LptBFGC system permease protein LptF